MKIYVTSLFLSLLPEDLLFQAAQSYEEFKVDKVHTGFTCPVQEGEVNVHVEYVAYTI